MRAPGSGPAVALALAVLGLGVGGCGWLDKSLECYELSGVSRRWSRDAESFSAQLEADLAQGFQRLERFDARSRAEFVGASEDLRVASDAVDGRVGAFLDEFAREFRSIDLDDPKLVIYRDRYVTQVEEVGTRIGELADTVRGLGELFAQVDPDRLTSAYQAERLQREVTQSEARIAAAERNLDAVTRAEEQLIVEINAYCQLSVPPGG